uniref:Uncharacterized protein n=1 Tax=Lutzomyia longipalpis TaxID=7200 RepID=A0A1B0CJ17_LUTLO
MPRKDNGKKKGEQGPYYRVTNQPQRIPLSLHQPSTLGTTTAKRKRSRKDDEHPTTKRRNIEAPTIIKTQVGAFVVTDCNEDTPRAKAKQSKNRQKIKKKNTTQSPPFEFPSEIRLVWPNFGTATFKKFTGSS